MLVWLHVSSFRLRIVGMPSSTAAVDNLRRYYVVIEDSFECKIKIGFFILFFSE